MCYIITYIITEPLWLSYLMSIYLVGSPKEGYSIQGYLIEY